MGFIKRKLKAAWEAFQNARKVFLHLLFFALPGGLAVVVVAGTEAWIRVGAWLGMGGPYGAADGMTRDEMGRLWGIGVGVVQTVVWAALYDRLYLRTPEEYIRSHWENRRPGPFIALLNFVGLGVASAFCVTLPAAATVLALYGLGVTAWWGRFPAAAVFLCGMPGLVAGITMIRRAVWLWRLRGQIENLATSKVHAAALGLVELKGTACDASGGPPPPSAGGSDGRVILSRNGSTYVTEPFLLQDDTGRVRVEPPAGHKRGEDERIVLTRRSVEKGAMVEATLLAGDSVYVLGNLETATGGPEGDGRVVRPLKTPYARLLDTTVLGAMPVASFLATFLGLGFVQHAEFFLLTDAEEEAAKRRFYRQWKRTLVWGLAWCACALPLVYWGLSGLIAPGSAGLLRAIP